MPNDISQALAAAFTKALTDESFRALLENNPSEAMKQVSPALPGGTTVNVVVDSDKVRHIVLPPAGKAVSEVAPNEYAMGF